MKKKKAVKTGHAAEKICCLNAVLYPRWYPKRKRILNENSCKTPSRICNSVEYYTSVNSSI